MNLLKNIKKFDAYPKTLEDFRIKTFAGGAISLISAILMILMFTSEINNYLTPSFREEIFVDTSRGGDKLKIHLDIVFHRVSCDFLSLDAMDQTGSQHEDITHNIYKRRLNLDGKPIEEPVRSLHIGESVTTNSSLEVTTQGCGSCYGAETPTKKCCNTCDELREAYENRRWRFDPSEMDQCKGFDASKLSDKILKAMKEGCQIYGYLEVSRVGGAFHFAPGKSFSVNHMHVHDMQPFSSSEFNMTHLIQHISFGQNQGVISGVNPLDGVVGVANKGSTIFQYYLKIVPTAYTILDGSTITSNQFSVTRHQKTKDPMGGESGIPGVFFNYELAALMVKYSEEEKSLGHFIAGLCAIIGGIFSVASILDKIVYTGWRVIRPKIQLGKAT